MSVCLAYDCLYKTLTMERCLDRKSKCCPGCPMTSFCSAAWPHGLCWSWCSAPVPGQGTAAWGSKERWASLSLFSHLIWGKSADILYLPVDYPGWVPVWARRPWRIFGSSQWVYNQHPNTHILLIMHSGTHWWTQSSALLKLKRNVSVTRACQNSRPWFLLELQNLISTTTRLNELT